MSSFHRVFLLVGAALFLVGLGLFLGIRPSVVPPPILTERLQEVAARAEEPFPSVETLSGPWFRVVPVPAVPQLKPQAPSPRTDNTNVLFLGSSKDPDGTPTFFFKFVPTSQVMVLKSGETRKGWTLKAVSDQMFTLVGSGGIYEVAR